MFIFRLTRPREFPPQWEDYISAVVVASTVEEARMSHPDASGKIVWSPHQSSWVFINEASGDADLDASSGWIRPEQVLVELLGVSFQPESRVLCSSWRTS